MRLMSRCTLSLVFLLRLPAPLLAQELAATSGAHAMTFVAIDRLQWSPIDVPGFEPGMRIAVLSGDPASDGSYTIRLAFPDGYRFPSHWHPQAENLTVLMGTFLLGEGTEEDPDAMTTYHPGDYLHIPPRSPHYGGATGSTVVQLHGTGPFEIMLSE